MDSSIAKYDSFINLIENIVRLGYRLTIEKELGRIKVTVFYNDFNNKLLHKCEQIIPLDDHIERLDSLIEFCFGTCQRLREEAKIQG